MIASLRGSVLSVGLDRIVLDVGGVGMLVHTTPATAAALRTGTETRLSTTLIVREESLTLFGFREDAERDLFEQVQTVSGVGPRLALAMLSVHPPEALRPAIAGGDLAALTKIPGIGKKSAERIVLELKDKVGVVPGAVAPVPAQPTAGNLDDDKQQVVDALVGLGWSTKQAQDAVGKIETDTVPAMLKAALQELGR